MEYSRPILTFRLLVFLLAVFYILVTLATGRWGEPGGPFRYLTIWALWGSAFVAFRVLLVSAGRSEQRFDGLVSAIAVINAMVVFLYWRLYFADPSSVTRDGALGVWWREYYLHGIGALLQWIDAFLINRAFRKIKVAALILLGIIAAYLVWSELIVARWNDLPKGKVTSGLPYPFLNDLEFPQRLEFYGTNLAVALVLLVFFAAIAWVLRKVVLTPVRD